MDVSLVEKIYNSMKILAKLLNMSRQQLSVVIGLLTGYLGLNGHLYKIGRDINPLCRRCLNGDVIVEHLLHVNPCQCHGVAFLDKVLESLNNSHMSQWTYFDGLPQK